MADCPECGANLTIDGKEEGEILECPDCGIELEIRAEGKVELAPQEEEDWGE